MKTIKILSLTIALAFTQFACSDYLNEENLGNITAENYYTTEAGFEGLVNAAYSSLREVYGPVPYIFCAGTDLFFNTHAEVPLGLSSYQTLTPGSSAVEQLFSSVYRSIQTNNLGLHYAELTETFPELPTRKAELQAIRAYLYFVLVQHFGDVSLVTELIDSPVTHFDRVPAGEVYQFIISELQAAIEVLPETQPNFGRITKRAAQHILAKAYLTRGYETYGQDSDFADAAQMADAAIQGQSLNLSFEELFAYKNDKNEEVLWSIQYSPGSTLNGGAHNWDYPWGPLVQGTNDGVNKKNTLHPTEYLFTLFADADTRFEGTFLNVRTNPYSGWRLDPDNSPVQYYYPRTAEQLASIESWRAENPETRTNTIITPIGPHWWDGLNQVDFPALKKFDRVQTPTIQYTHDLYLARLGETYLVAAEAYFQAGDVAKAVERINEVRRRAAAPGQEATMLISAADLDLDFILDERARELAGEGFRWYDLKRTGKLIEYTRERNPDIKSLFDSGINPFMGTDGKLKILRPIPLSAIALDNGDYPQNPGYN